MSLHLRVIFWEGIIELIKVETLWKDTGNHIFDKARHSARLGRRVGLDPKPIARNKLASLLRATANKRKTSSPALSSTVCSNIHEAFGQVSSSFCLV